MKILLAIVTAFMLSACATAPAVLGTVKDRAERASDIYAQGAMADDCAITYGAYTRLPLNQRLALELNCGGNWLETLKTIGVLKDAIPLNENTTSP